MGRPAIAVSPACCQASVVEANSAAYWPSPRHFGILVSIAIVRSRRHRMWQQPSTCFEDLDGSCAQLTHLPLGGGSAPALCNESTQPRLGGQADLADPRNKIPAALGAPLPPRPIFRWGPRGLRCLNANSHMQLCIRILAAMGNAAAY